MQVAFAPIYDLDPPAAGRAPPPVRRGGALPLRHRGQREPRHHPALHPGPDPVPAPAPGFLEATIQVAGARTHVYVTHLDYRGDPTVRSMQVADTRRILAEDPAGANQVLLGDFNAEAGRPGARAAVGRASRTAGRSPRSAPASPASPTRRPRR